MAHETAGRVIELRVELPLDDGISSPDVHHLAGQIRTFLVGRAGRREARTLERLCTPSLITTACATSSGSGDELARFPLGGTAAELAPMAVGVLCAIAAHLRANEKLVDAEFICHQAVALAVEHFGSHSLEAAEVHRRLGAIHESAGDVVAAEAAYERALALVEEVKGHDDIGVAKMRRALAWLEGLRGHHAAGEAHARRALDIRLRTLGPKAESARDAVVLSSLLLAQGKCEEAESLLRFALSVVESNHGPNSSEAAERVHDLGGCLAVQRRAAEAAACFERALRIRRTLLGPADPEIATTLHNLALAKEAAGEAEEARRLWAEAAAAADAAMAHEPGRRK